MKNKTVEVMYRTDFNISKDTEVEVEFLMSGAGWAEYSVKWLDGDVLKQSIVKLPQQLPVEIVF